MGLQFEGDTTPHQFRSRRRQLAVTKHKEHVAMLKLQNMYLHSELQEWQTWWDGWRRSWVWDASQQQDEQLVEVPVPMT